jgi:hypothetical protein
VGNGRDAVQPKRGKDQTKAEGPALEAERQKSSGEQQSAPHPKRGLNEPGFCCHLRSQHPLPNEKSRRSEHRPKRFSGEQELPAGKAQEEAGKHSEAKQDALQRGTRSLAKTLET